MFVFAEGMTVSSRRTTYGGDGIAGILDAVCNVYNRLVDPIDGTRSFALGKPEFTISVALVEAGRPILGVILNPAKDELFEVETAGVPLLNGKAIQASTTTTLDGAAIVVSHTENRRRRFSEWFPQAHVTEIGSLAYKLARVAAGHFDAYFSWRWAHDWDIAAAALLLERVGAGFSDAEGAPLAFNRSEPRHHGLIAANEPLHLPLVDKSKAKRLG